MYWLFSGYIGVDYKVLQEHLAAAGRAPYPDTSTTKNGELIYSNEPTNFHDIDYLNTSVYTNTENVFKDRRIYGIRTRVHNTHDGESINAIRRKNELHAGLADSKFIARTYDLAEFKYSGGVWIIRPAHLMAFSGADITVVSSQEEFDGAKGLYDKRALDFSRYKAEHLRQYSVIVSEYIAQPLLFRGYKFHIRLYMLTRQGAAPAIARDHGQLLTAGAQYIQGDWQNKEIHDTHLGSTIDELVFPDDYPGDVAALNAQLDELERELAPLCVKHTPYASQAQLSYQVFGLDVMVREDGSAVLLEINDGPGFKHITKDTARLDDFNARHCNWIWACIRDWFN